MWYRPCSIVASCQTVSGERNEVTLLEHPFFSVPKNPEMFLVIYGLFLLRAVAKVATLDTRDHSDYSWATSRPDLISFISSVHRSQRRFRFPIKPLKRRPCHRGKLLPVRIPTNPQNKKKRSSGRITLQCFTSANLKCKQITSPDVWKRLH